MAPRVVVVMRKVGDSLLSEANVFQYGKSSQKGLGKSFFFQ